MTGKVVVFPKNPESTSISKELMVLEAQEKMIQSLLAQDREEADSSEENSEQSQYSSSGKLFFNA